MNRACLEHSLIGQKSLSHSKELRRCCANRVRHVWDDLNVPDTLESVWFGPLTLSLDLGSVRLSFKHMNIIHLIKKSDLCRNNVMHAKDNLKAAPGSDHVLHINYLSFFPSFSRWRFIASVQSSPRGNTAERKEFHSGSRSTPLNKMKVGNILSTCTLPAARSKSLRWRHMHASMHQIQGNVYLVTDLRFEFIPPYFYYTEWLCC